MAAMHRCLHRCTFVTRLAVSVYQCISVSVYQCKHAPYISRSDSDAMLLYMSGRDGNLKDLSPR